MTVRTIAPAIAIFILIATSACSQHTGQSLQISVTTTQPDLAAEFETTVSSATQPEQHYRWRFWRSAQRIETLNLQDQTGEVWFKQSNGKIEYQQLFHAQKQAIIYYPGDLSTIGIAYSWTALSSLLSPQQIASVHAEGHSRFLGRTAEHYSNGNPQQLLAVTWLAQEQIPAILKWSESGRNIVSQLTAVYPLPRSPWPHQDSSGYRSTDFADLGDKETDPFIKSVLPKLKAQQQLPSH